MIILQTYIWLYGQFVLLFVCFLCCFFLFVQEACSNKLEWFRGLRKQLGTFDNSKKEALLYFPPETEQNDFVTVDFYCLLSIEQWHLDKSSKVYLRFAAKELGTFDSCHGPMLLKGKRFAICPYIMLCSNCGRVA